MARSPPSIRSTRWICSHKVDEAAGEAGATPDVLVQVDLAGETTKYGAPEADVREHRQRPRMNARPRGSSA